MDVVRELDVSYKKKNDKKHKREDINELIRRSNEEEVRRNIIILTRYFMHHCRSDSGFHDGGDVGGERIIHFNKIHPNTHEL
jgi:hypothetical protein